MGTVNFHYFLFLIQKVSKKIKKNRSFYTARVRAGAPIFPTLRLTQVKDNQDQSLKSQ
jgi:hypothetical protein